MRQKSCTTAFFRYKFRLKPKKPPKNYHLTVNRRQKKARTVSGFLFKYWYRWPESNRHSLGPPPPQGGVSTSSTTSAKIAYSFGATGTSEALSELAAPVGAGTSDGADGTSICVV